MGDTLSIRTPFLSGVSKPLGFTIKEAGVGFKPDTLTMTVYDRDDRDDRVAHSTPAIVNGRNDVDVLASCSDAGVVRVTLDPADTTITPPIRRTPTYAQPRHVLFTYTWGSPPEVGKYQVTMLIAPDYEPLAV